MTFVQVVLGHLILKLCRVTREGQSDVHVSHKGPTDQFVDMVDMVTVH